jgi:hypothetical protein
MKISNFHLKKEKKPYLGLSKNDCPAQSGMRQPLQNNPLSGHSHKGYAE